MNENTQNAAGDTSPETPPGASGNDAMGPAPAETTKDGREAGQWRFALVVEDSMPLRRMFCKILSTHNVKAVEAANGKEALDALAEHGVDKFGLIVSDLMMPVLDGPGFIAAAKKAYDDSLPPIIVCSSRSDREAVEVVMKLGINGYILKPFKTETVIEKLRELFPETDEGSE